MRACRYLMTKRRASSSGDGVLIRVPKRVPSRLGLTAGVERVLPDTGPMSDYVNFCAVIAGLALIAWSCASIYFIRVIDWEPMASAAVMLALAYPLVRLLLGPVDRWLAGPRTLNLERRT